MILSLPWPPSILSPNTVAHWTKKATTKKRYKHDCMWLAKTVPQPEFSSDKLPLHIRFCPPDKRRRDMDNCLASLKAGLDGLSEAWAIDDRHFVLSLEMGNPVKRG